MQRHKSGIGAPQLLSSIPGRHPSGVGICTPRAYPTWLRMSVASFIGCYDQAMPLREPILPANRQFSLRALLVAIAAVCCVCALFPMLGTETAVCVLCMVAAIGIVALAIQMRRWWIGLFLLIPLVVFDAMQVPRSWAGQSQVAVSIDIRDATTGGPVTSALVALESRDGTRLPARKNGYGNFVVWCECLTHGRRQAFSSTYFAVIPVDDYLCVDAPGYRSVRAPLVQFFQDGTWDLKLEPQPSLKIDLQKDGISSGGERE